jgi:D-alanine-D-alanine ligase
MSQKNIVVLFGGTSTEHEISIVSATAVINWIDRHNIIPVYITKQGKWLLYDGKLDNIRHIDWEKFGTPAVLSPDRVNRGLLRVVGDKVRSLPVDLVFPVLHGPYGEDGTIQGLCELAGIPYVGCGVLSSALCMDKAVTKLVVKSLKIPQAEHLTFTPDELTDISDAMKSIRYRIGYPCVIKPAVGGSSVGITKVSNKKELQAALEEAMRHSPKIIAEKAIAGREIECAVLGIGGGAEAAPPGEILSNGEMYDYEAKYGENSFKAKAPADLPKQTAAEIRRMALAVFKAVDGKGLARVDFFVTKDNKIVFNEINTMPGFTGMSLYARMWETAGVSGQQLVERLIDIALS